MPNYDTNPETSCPLLTTTEREEAAFEQLEKLEEHRGRSSKHLFALLITTCLAFALILSTGFAFSFLVFKRNASNPNKTVHEHSTCKIPPLRQEWRSLSQNSKASYIRAVQCLKTLPSALGLNQTLYDDFPWVHKQHGEYSHNAAPFLAWHRYFIHTYEQSLQRECGYEGQLTYWDWTLDWENITTSPVWDLEYGFGGSGNTSMRPAVFDAYCVTDGPFAWLEVPYFEDIYRPHCLLRGFDETLVDFRDALRPEALQELLMIEDYDSFNLGLENGPHIAIPKSIHGDFSLHTAPFDPVFFLHHTQLDRMWWRWQHIDLPTRGRQYLGRAETNVSRPALLQDILPMGGLAADIEVSEIMSTESDILCYHY